MLENNAAHPTYSADFTQPSTGASDEAPPDESDAKTYELMSMSQQKYLCSIPVLPPPKAENETANELAKAAEAKEHTRAAANGWDLLAGLDETCLYFGSGWWTYSFCHNREIVQYHALPTSPTADQPPRRDPRTMAFTLGREPAIPAASRQKAKSETSSDLLPAELQITGDQRYLVQKLERGDVCDLTGRERTIEVRYECVPGSKKDRIGYIKEVTICAYLMVIYTPKLCNDVAFLPREEPRANPISCRPVVEDINASKPPTLDPAIPVKEEIKGGVQAGKPGQHLAGQTAAGDAAAPPTKYVNIGGVLVGARNVLSTGDEAGKPPTKLTAPGSWPDSAPKKKKKVISRETVAQGASKEEGGATEVLSKAEIDDLGLSFDVIQEMREQLESLSGDKGWKLEVVQEEGGQRELRGWIYPADGEEAPQNEGEEWHDKDEYDDDDGEEGSTENFKDEL